MTKTKEEDSMISSLKKMTSILAMAVVFITGTNAVALGGAVRGPQSAIYKLPGRMVDTMYVTFFGGEKAEVGVIGDGVTNLDLYVYDSQGNLVNWDDGSSDLCYVKWSPRFTAVYTIQVINRGSVYNVYKIVTN